ncbi:MAG: glucose-6-phosphate dehydrogenase [Chlamydiota bacterium]
MEGSAPPHFEENNKRAGSCSLVIFGATGDLTGRKLMPAIYHLGRDGLLPPHFACVGFARRTKTDEQFRKEMRCSVEKHAQTQPLDSSFWEHFSQSLFYHTSQFDDDEGYRSLKALLTKLDRERGTEGSRIFYLSVQPKFFPLITSKLKEHGMIVDFRRDSLPFSRVIIEKPFGRDSSSAHELQKHLEQSLHEEQIYRIDHYLGKETVQNILVFRFANAIFESLWNNRHIDHVQITVAESIGIGTRGKFFEEQGIVRDVIQNHMIQLLSLTAMEPPANLSPIAIRGEKVKVLECLRPLEGKDLSECLIRGQYAPGFIDGKSVPGYREEADVSPHSTMETFCSLRIFIDNWRWAGVPFYLRAGKRLPKRGTEIAVVFKDAPGILFKEQGSNPSNVLAIRIQPDEGISMRINCKVPGPESPIQPVKMDFRYGSYFGKAPPEAYERLIWDCMVGDSTLFAGTNEEEHSWKFFTPILDHFEEQPSEQFFLYDSGSWGPAQADALLQGGRSWRLL